MLCWLIRYVCTYVYRKRTNCFQITYSTLSSLPFLAIKKTLLQYKQTHMRENLSLSSHSKFETVYISMTKLYCLTVLLFRNTFEYNVAISRSVGEITFQRLSSMQFYDAFHETPSFMIWICRIFAGMSSSITVSGKVVSIKIVTEMDQRH